MSQLVFNMPGSSSQMRWRAMVRRTISGHCLLSVRNSTGVKLGLFRGTGRGQPSGSAYSRLSCGPFSFNELVAQGTAHSGLF